MKKTILCLLPLLCAMEACTGGDVSNESNVSVPDPQLTSGNGPICYVLCDFSNSQNAASQTDIVDNAKAIFTKLHSQFALVYFNINAPQFQKPFFQHAPPKVSDIETPSEGRQRDTLLNKAAARLGEKLDSLQQNARAQFTCIIKALGNIANRLASDAQNKVKQVRIIILSDMLEVCQNDFGAVNLERPPYERAVQLLQQMNEPAYGFGGYGNLDISVIASSQKMIADDSGLLYFWKQVFAKYGYQFNKPITAELPAWLNQ